MRPRKKELDISSALQRGQLSLVSLRPRRHDTTPSSAKSASRRYNTVSSAPAPRLTFSEGCQLHPRAVCSCWGLNRAFLLDESGLREGLTLVGSRVVYCHRVDVHEASLAEMNEFCDILVAVTSVLQMNRVVCARSRS